jgi:polyisoprenoid-binding protein YceI
MKSGAIAALAVGLFAAHPAQAQHWVVDHARSRLGFTVQWSNEPFTAVFKRWNADIAFDPDNLSGAHVTVTIDLGSESSDQPDFDSGLQGAEGFQTTQFPTARFVTTKFTRRSSNFFEAQGTLTLHGISRDVTLPFTLAISGRSAHMVGTAHVLRTDFGLGTGAWAAPSPVSRDVVITVDLTATQ